jgi:hypothetical protein
VSRYCPSAASEEQKQWNQGALQLLKRRRRQQQRQQRRHLISGVRCSLLSSKQLSG